MAWFSQNWVWVLLFAGFIAMHMFGHGGHGGARGGGDGDDPGTAAKSDNQPGRKPGTGHQH